MAIPIVQATNTAADSSNSASTTVTLPSGIVAGELIIVFMGYANTTCTVQSWTGGFTQLFDLQQTAGANEGLACGYKKAVGGETSITVNFTGGNTRSAYTCYRISGAADPATQLPTYSSDVGQNSSPNPPNHAPVAGAKDYLWLAAASSSHNSTYSAFSTNYTNGIQANTGTVNAGHCVTGSCQRGLNASSQDPAVWTHAQASQAEWISVTMAVHPVAAAPITISCNTASLPLTDVQSAVISPYTLAAATSQFLLSDVQASLDADTVIAGATARLLLTCVPASVKIVIVINANSNLLQLFGVQASIDIIITISGATCQLLLSDVQAAILSPYTLSAGTSQLQFTVVQASITAATTISVSTRQLLLSGVRATINATAIITGSTPQLQLACVRATISGILVIDANTARLLLTGVQAVFGQPVVISADTAVLLIIDPDVLAFIDAKTTISAGTKSLLLTGVQAVVGGIVSIGGRTALLVLAADIEGARVGTAIVGTARIGFGGPIRASVVAPTTIPGSTEPLTLSSVLAAVILSIFTPPQLGESFTRWTEYRRERVVVPRRKPILASIEAMNRDLETQRPIVEQMQEEYTKAQFEIDNRRIALEQNLDYLDEIIEDPGRIARMRDDARRRFEQSAREEMREERKRLKKKQTALINLQKAQVTNQAARERQAELARQREQNLKKARRVLKKKRGA